MNWHIRSFDDKDLEAIVQLSLLAWEPVFRSFQQILGPNIFPLLYPDWRKIQKEVVETPCKDKAKFKVLVAELDEKVVGFLAYELKDEIGEVYLLAVHPDSQNQGIGTELNMVALEQMKAAGMKLVQVGTGGDEGHAPARRAYEKAGYVGLPSVYYFKAL